MRVDRSTRNTLFRAYMNGWWNDRRPWLVIVICRLAAVGPVRTYSVICLLSLLYSHNLLIRHLLVDEERGFPSGLSKKVFQK